MRVVSTRVASFCVPAQPASGREHPCDGTPPTSSWPISCRARVAPSGVWWSGRSFPGPPMARRSSTVRASAERSPGRAPLDRGHGQLPVLGSPGFRVGLDEGCGVGTWVGVPVGVTLVGAGTPGGSWDGSPVGAGGLDGVRDGIGTVLGSGLMLGSMLGGSVGVALALTLGLGVDVGTVVGVGVGVGAGVGVAECVGLRDGDGLGSLGAGPSPTPGWSSCGYPGVASHSSPMPSPSWSV